MYEKKVFLKTNKMLLSNVSSFVKWFLYIWNIYRATLLECYLMKVFKRTKNNLRNLQTSFILIGPGIAEPSKGQSGCERLCEGLLEFNLWIHLQQLSWTVQPRIPDRSSKFISVIWHRVRNYISICVIWYTTLALTAHFSRATHFRMQLGFISLRGACPFSPYLYF